MPKQTFEKAMEKLEQIVRELENGDVSLDKALQKFEQGIHLSQFCNQKLDETEKKISILLKDKSGNIIESPYNDFNEPNDD